MQYYILLTYKLIATENLETINVSKISKKKVNEDIYLIQLNKRETFNDIGLLYIAAFEYIIRTIQKKNQ